MVQTISLSGRGVTFVLLIGLLPRTLWAGALTPDGSFPIGVWSQPTYKFDDWQARGVNTLVKYESYGGQTSLDAWSAAADGKGLYQIREPRSNTAADVANPRILAWMQPDEPDYRQINASVLSANYATWKTAAPNKPVFTNFSGGNLLKGWATTSTYSEYLSATDWVGNDLYPVTGWGRPDWIDYSRTASDRMTAGMGVQRLAQLKPGAPQFAIIETSNQQLSWINNPRGVTPPELRGQVWDAIIRGASGIVYFPYRLGGFSYDATPTDVVAEMTRVNAQIQSVAGILTSAVDPADAGLLLSLGNAVLEGTMRSYVGDKYFFVLNMSSQALTDVPVSLPGLGSLANVGVLGESRLLGIDSGLITDSFAPWELHVYHADLNSGIQGVEVPEPASVWMGLALLGLGLARRRR